MKKKVVIPILVVGLVLLLALFRPFSGYDLSQVHPRIQALRQPFQRVIADYYLDGGSVGLEIIDRDGQKLLLAIPINDGPGDTRTYHRLYIGARYIPHTNAVEEAFTEDTRRYLADLIGRHAKGPDRDCALIALRGSPRDYVDVYWREFRRRATVKKRKRATAHGHGNEASDGVQPEVCAPRTVVRRRELQVPGGK